MGGVSDVSGGNRDGCGEWLIIDPVTEEESGGGEDAEDVDDGDDVS